jgi:histidinol phosphatase-like enzyme
MDKKTFVFDIDGTICTMTYGNYDKAEPFLNRIEKVNALYDAGHTIIFLTARGMGSTNNNIQAAYAKMYDYTEKQLKGWGIKFHSLFLGKPFGHVYVDDRGSNDEDFFEEHWDGLLERSKFPWG